MLISTSSLIHRPTMLQLRCLIWSSTLSPTTSRYANTLDLCRSSPICQSRGPKPGSFGMVWLDIEGMNFYRLISRDLTQPQALSTGIQAKPRTVTSSLLWQMRLRVSDFTSVFTQANRIALLRMLQVLLLMILGNGPPSWDHGLVEASTPFGVCSVSSAHLRR